MPVTNRETVFLQNSQCSISYKHLFFQYLLCMLQEEAEQSNVRHMTGFLHFDCLYHIKIKWLQPRLRLHCPRHFTKIC